MSSFFCRRKKPSAFKHYKQTTMKQDIYELITEKLIQSLEQGVAPWRKPWNNGGLPRNAISNRHYSGINAFLLSCHGGDRFLTFKQALEAGGNVRKGEKGCPVIYWNWVERNKGGVVDKIPFLKHFTVFSVDQCDGLNLPANEAQEGIEFVPVDKAEATIKATGASIRHGGSQAFYIPSMDSISLPNKESFHSIGEYYSTAFHELVHWTGHASRLARKGIEESHAFGSPVYSKEELVAEMGAAFLCGSHGIDSTLENSAAYLQGWIAKLKGDPKLAMQASSCAAKAARFILGEGKDEEA